jgi:hypothetical protein
MKTKDKKRRTMTNPVISSVKEWSNIHVEAKSVVLIVSKKNKKAMKRAILDETYRFSTHSIIRLVGDLLKKTSRT